MVRPRPSGRSGSRIRSSEERRMFDRGEFRSESYGRERGVPATSLSLLPATYVPPSAAGSIVVQPDPEVANRGRPGSSGRCRCSTREDPIPPALPAHLPDWHPRSLSPAPAISQPATPSETPEERIDRAPIRSVVCTADAGSPTGAPADPPVLSLLRLPARMRRTQDN